uniref:histidine kinase n=1 Tax=Solibacter usitatus (strain Ellin6076) TaxID=234267 RepID=Q02BV0_SOLUE
MVQPLELLFIGESGVDAVVAELRRGGYSPSIRCANTLTELESALTSRPDIAISDFSIEPGFGALEALRVIQDQGVDLPVIVVSGKIRDSDVLAVLKAGAADHLTRTNLMRLNAAVERELRSARMRTDRVRLEEQFRQAQKMEAVGRLAGGVAHDFNNLLTVITGYSDLLLGSRDLKEAQRSALEEIRRSAERGGALTHQLLAFSRRQPMQARPLKIDELVLHMERMLRRLIGEDVELVTIAASSETVFADPGRLEQVIMNLVVNARDAMPGGGKLTIETGSIRLNDGLAARHLGVPPGQYVTIFITDTGVGMDQETQSHLFEPFFTTKNPGRGTGLGLATVYGIIRQSGGAIGIASEPGKGTSANIYLPRAKEKAEPAVDRPPALMPLTGRETILVVEDEARVRKLIVDVLTGRGYRVLEATRGEEALRICKTHADEIDLAVVDVVMPEMNGPDLIRQMQPICKGIRVLYISGYTDEAMIHHGIPESGAAFLQKPFVPDQLARKVREVLDARANAAEGQ